MDRRLGPALRMLFTLAWGAALAVLSGCVALPERLAAELRAPAAAEASAFGPVDQGTIGSPDQAAMSPALNAAQPKVWRAFSVDQLPLASGQVIVSEAGGAMSLLYSLVAAEYAPWIHAGIVSVEDGAVVVYEANADLSPLPGLVPTDALRGGVRRIGIEKFARGKRIIGLYALPPEADAVRLVAFAQEQHRRRTPFDPFFDSDDSSALYCTELVALALAEAGVARVEPTPMQRNASLASGLDWLHIRSPAVYLAGHIVAPLREVARWSPELSPAQIDAYFAAKRELHRRFDDRARLGQLFDWTGLSLRYRPGVQRFVDAALAEVPEALRGGTEAALRIEHLARQHFEGAPLHEGDVQRVSALPPDR
ncbi:MAG: hypothetical protein ABI641_08825 [Caldimonas sp.]